MLLFRLLLLLLQLYHCHSSGCGGDGDGCGDGGVLGVDVALVLGVEPVFLHLP